MTAISFSVQSKPRDLGSWVEFARHVESAGFTALLVGDHPGYGAAPWPALGAAAAVTTTIGLGTYVLQTGLRDPMQVASDAATLDILAPNRVRLGLGAGHTFREWEALGSTRPSGRDRAARLAEFVEAVSALLAGETVTLAGDHLQLVDARLDGLPSSGGVQLVVGGAHPRILEAAARHADIVALSGLDRTLPDGHSHSVRWNDATLSAQLELVRAAATEAARTPVVEVLVHKVTLTDDRAGELDELSEALEGAPTGELAATPFALVGTLEQLEQQVRRQAEDRGITHYVVREPDVPVIEQLIQRLA